RLKTKTYQDGSEVSYTYTPGGRIDTVTDAGGVTDNDYDFRGRLTNVENPDGTEISYTYYPNGNRKTVTVPSGTTTYTYDGLNRPDTVIAPDESVTVYTYDDAGNRESVAYPNGTVAGYDYDSLNRLTELRNEKASGELISGYVYTLKTDGNRESVTETPANRVVSYEYDNLNRLTEENITDPANGNETISYSYDDFGNRLTKTDSSGTVTYSYDDNDRLETETGNGFSVTYTYDDNGNTRTKDDGTDIVTYGYNYEDRLVSVVTPQSSVGYAYDYDGIRVRSTTDGIVTYYLVDKNRDYAQVLGETDLTGSLIVSYIYGDDLISQDRNDSDFYYHYDGLGSTRTLTDDTAGVTDTYMYDAYGNLLSSTGTTENNYLFTGEQFDPNVGFYYLRARYYNPDTGGFVTSDPWKGNIYDPPSLHK
ncbi:MAG: sugar-binding protein, partial [bacterium]|nr:sugar-binding protein [bacterium]